MYGWSSNFPLSVLTASATARDKGIANQPDSPQVKKNLSLLSNFLGKIPFKFRLTSAYRNTSLNNAIKGSSRSSQHLQGLAVDLVPDPGGPVNNRQLADWFYEFRGKFPELDQVIWYRDSSHLHIGICPNRATGCARSKPRGEFGESSKEGGWVVPYATSPLARAQQALLFAKNRPLKTGVALGTITVIAYSAIILTGLLFLVLRRR